MPVAIADRRILRLFVLCALYVAQGIPFGFVTVTLAAYLADAGATTDEVGSLLAVATLPWAFKWAWGPVLDRFSRSAMGRRRPWILGAQSMMVITAGALIVIPELREDLVLLGWVVFAHNVFASLQDVSVDALAVDLLPESERGKANGLMYGSSYLGLFIGGAGLSTVLGTYGLRVALIVQVIALTSIMLLPLLVREQVTDALFALRRHELGARSEGSMAAVVRDLWRAFARRSPLLGAGLALTVDVGLGALAAVSTVLLMQDLGWTQAEYGQMVGGLPLFFGLGGSVAGGFIADRFGHRRVVAIASVLLGLAWLGFAAGKPWWHYRSFIVTTTCIEQLLMGTLSAALFALYMDVSWPKVAATQFTAYMAMLNLSRTLGAKLAGPVTAAAGVAGAFLAFGALQIVVVAWLVRIDPHQNRRELG